jgi:hypothetical protein
MNDMSTKVSTQQNSRQQSQGNVPSRILWLNGLGSAMLLAGLFMPLSNDVVANDVNIAPASCQAPFLNQAFPMRWHENYIMNPTSNPTATWVICPIPFDNDTLPSTFGIAVAGGIMGGASSDLPTCFVTAQNGFNLSQPPYISGPSFKLTSSMTVELLANDPRVWYGTRGIKRSDWETALVDLDGGAASLFCKLPPGYSISTVLLNDDF